MPHPDLTLNPSGLMTRRGKRSPVRSRRLWRVKGTRFGRVRFWVIMHTYVFDVIGMMRSRCGTRLRNHPAPYYGGSRILRTTIPYGQLVHTRSFLILRRTFVGWCPISNATPSAKSSPSKRGRSFSPTTGGPTAVVAHESSQHAKSILKVMSARAIQLTSVPTRTATSILQSPLLHYRDDHGTR